MANHWIAQVKLCHSPWMDTHTYTEGEGRDTYRRAFKFITHSFIGVQEKMDV